MVRWVRGSFVVRRVLTLFVLASQVAATFAAPAISVCISPKGHICLDTIWNDCTCCQEEDCQEGCTCCNASTASGAPSGAANEDEDCQDGCACTGQHEGRSPPTAAVAALAVQAPDSPTWNGKPCRCKHIPLAVEQPSRVPQVVDRPLVESRLLLDWCSGLNAVVVNPVAPFDPLTNLSHHPPPLPGHLLSLSCVVLRC